MSDLLYKSQFYTPLGLLDIYASSKVVRYLNYSDSHKIKYILKALDASNNQIIEEENSHIKQTKEEIFEYFNQNRKTFNISLDLKGTEFQLSVWSSLLEIPYGKTISYLDQAKNISNPKAVRAVANANGRNPISILVPCHRVIGSNGKLTGYAGGIERKKFLLKLENPQPTFDF